MMKVSDLLQSRHITGIDKPISKSIKPRGNETKKIDFADTMKDFLEAVNSDKLEAGQKVSDVIQGF